MKKQSPSLKTYTGIASYPDPDLKAQFLRDGARVLRAIGQELAPHGATITVRTSRGGHAVSGEVYGELRLVGQPFHLLVEVGSSCCRVGRTDGVFIMVQRRETVGTGTHARTHIIGQNIYLDPSQSTFALASRVLDLFDSIPLRWAA